MPLSANITLTDLARVSRRGVLDFKAEARAAARLIGELKVKTPGPWQLARNLSGGNQQKIVLAKWLFRESSVLIFDEPTRGIDVGAKYEIYLLLWDLASRGKGQIMVSSDLSELMGVCHRILVFSGGRVAGQVLRPDFDQERILNLAYQAYLH